MRSRLLEIFHQLQEAPIALRVLFSAVIGIVLASTFIYPFDNALFHYTNFGNIKVWEWESILRKMLNGPLLAFWACIFMSPLIIIAMTVATVFQRNIQKHLISWCIFSVFVIPLFSVTFFLLTGSEERNILIILKRNDLYVWGPIFPALIFYLISSKNKKKVV